MQKIFLFIFLLITSNSTYSQINLSVNTTNVSYEYCGYVVVDPASITYGYNIFGNGSINISATGGTAPYGFKLIYPSRSQTTGFFINLIAGTYSFQITDANGIAVDTNITITNIFPQPSVNPSNINSPSTCYSSDGSFTLNGSGGTPPYTYSVDGGTTFTSNNTFTNLSQTSFPFILLRDANGLLASTQVSFGNTGCSFNISGGLNLAPNAGSCSNNAGIITVASSGGGTPPFQYSDDGVNYFNGTFDPYIGGGVYVYSFYNLSPGLHSFYGKDVNGIISIIQLPVFKFCNISITYLEIDAACHQGNGSIVINASNGALPYTYSIDGINFQTSNTFTGLNIGNYYIWVKDANGVISSSSATVYDKCPIVSVSDTDEVCGNSNGSIVASGIKGTRPYQFSIDNGINFQIDSLFPGLHAGNFKVILKDANGFMDSIVVTINNNCLLVSGISTNKTCGVNNGTITATGIGGTPSYRYSIDGINFQYNNIFNGLDSGTYIVTIEDEYGLTDTTKVIVADTPSPIINLGNDTTLCSGQTLNLVPIISGTVTSYKWQDGSTNNSYLVSHAGQYWLKANMNGCIISDTINIAYLLLSNKIFSTNDTTLCVGNSIVLNAGNPGATYIWDDNSNQQIRLVNNSGEYWVTVNTNGCSVSDTIMCHFISAPLIDLGNDTTLCSGQKLLINPGVSNATYLWSNNTTADSLVINQTGKYWLTATANGCSNSDTIQVAYNPVPFVFLGNDTSVCIGNNILLKAPISTFYQYLWQDNSIANSYAAITTGIYFVKVTNQFNCTTADSILIHFNPIPIFSLGNDTSLCNGQFLKLQASLVGDYLWNTGSNSSFLNIDAPGLYWLQVTQSGCTKADSIAVSYKPNPSIDLGNDTTLCDGQTLLLNVTTNNGDYLWQDGSLQPTYLVNNSGMYSVKVTVDGCDTTGQLNVNYTSIPSINLGSDTSICITEKLLLNANFPQSSYLWQDGSIQSTYNVTKEGKYLVSVTNECGTGVDSINVEYQNCACEFYVPSAFTPNNDFKNDIFKPVYQCLFSNYSLSVYNRYGQLIFESQNADEGWNGTFYGQPQEEGTYVWIIKYVDSVTGKAVNKKGTIILLR